MSWKKIGKVLKTLFYVLGFIGLVDMTFQGFFHTECGPVLKVLSIFVPSAPGSVKCRCEDKKQVTPVPK